jgi:hypothetical protein
MINTGGNRANVSLGKRPDNDNYAPNYPPARDQFSFQCDHDEYSLNPKRCVRLIRRLLFKVGEPHLATVKGAFSGFAELGLEKVLANLWNRTRITKEAHAGRGQEPE